MFNLSTHLPQFWRCKAVQNTFVCAIPIFSSTLLKLWIFPKYKRFFNKKFGLGRRKLRLPRSLNLLGAIDCGAGVRTFVRTDICSNRRKVEQMSVRTNVLQLFWQFFKSSDRSNWPIETADHSLESLLQINKDRIRTKSQLKRELTEKPYGKSHLISNYCPRPRTKSQLERELTEKLCRKLHMIPKWYFICDHNNINCSLIMATLRGPAAGAHPTPWTHVPPCPKLNIHYWCTPLPINSGIKIHSIKFC